MAVGNDEAPAVTPAREPNPAAEDSMKRLLYVAHRIPYPPDKGERVRAYHEIVALSRAFEITLVAPCHGPSDLDAAGPLGQWCKRVIVGPKTGGALGRLRAGMSMLRGRSATEGFFAAGRLGRMLADLTARERFDVVFSYCTGVWPACRQAAGGAHVIDYVDVDSRKWLDYAERSGGPMSIIYRTEAKAVARLEHDALEVCDAAFITSSAEARLLPRPARATPMAVGVDSEYFRPGAGGGQPGDDKPASPSLVFTGWMSYRPNADGVCWFAREVLPQLRRRYANVTFTIVGANPAPRVTALAEQNGITVTGRVPDVRPYIDAADVAVVPLQIARGVQNKVLEALAMGKPLVGSAGALTGLDLKPGRDVLRAETPDEWVEAIASLVDADGLTERGRQLAGQARQCAVERFNWDAILAPMVEACVRLAGGDRPAACGTTAATAKGASR